MTVLIFLAEYREYHYNYTNNLLIFVYESKSCRKKYGNALTLSFLVASCSIDVQTGLVNIISI